MQKQDIRETLTNPQLLRSIGASWKLLFFLLLQSDITNKSYSASPTKLAEVLAVSLSTLSAWINRLQSLKIIAVKNTTEKMRFKLLSPFNKIFIVSEEIYEDRGTTLRKSHDFDDSTTDIYLKRKFRSLQKIEEDVDFIFNKLQSLDLRLNAIEGSYQQYQSSKKKS